MLDGRDSVERSPGPAPELILGRGTQPAMVPIDPAPRVPPADLRSEWRGTLPEALRESAAKNGVAGFASADWASQSALRVTAPQELAASIERTHARVAANEPQPRVYTVGADGTIYNTVTNRAEYVPVRERAVEQEVEALPSKPEVSKPPELPSGATWVNRFPASQSTEDLAPEFGANVDRFIGALRGAGADVDVATTLRPTERAYLMHYAWKIGKDGLDPETVPKMAGVEIDWVHRKPDGSVDLAASRAAANAMNAGYGSVHQPSLTSRHGEGRAIDMAIHWTGDLVIPDASGNAVTIKSTPRDGTNAQLAQLGATYGVVKLQGDRPHWSDDGH
jgi:hypothetical protein